MYNINKAVYRNFGRKANNSTIGDKYVKSEIRQLANIA